MSETSQDTAHHVRKTRVGVVISDKMNKTLVVEHVARVFRDRVPLEGAEAGDPAFRVPYPLRHA